MMRENHSVITRFFVKFFVSEIKTHDEEEERDAELL
jgi:hypothetical protein